MENTLQETLHKTTGLDRLISPFSTDDFLNNYWEKEPLVVRRNQEDFYHSLFSSNKIDHVLQHSRPKGAYLRVVKNQQPMLPSKYENADGSLNLKQLYVAYSEGYTVVINELHRFWNPLHELCYQLHQQLGHPVVANMYLTPENEVALWPHYDTHDVFVVQVEGKKHWRIYPPTVETPLLHSFQPTFKRDELGEAREITLQAGDIMYMPRGVPHDVYTSDQHSLHLTIGVHPKQWLDLFQKGLHALALHHPGLRKALPVGYHRAGELTESEQAVFKNSFQELLNIVSSQISPAAGIQLLTEEFMNEISPPVDGHFSDLNQADHIQLDTELEKIAGMPCEIFMSGSVARLKFPGNMVKFPSVLLPAVEFIADAQGPFQVHELPYIPDKNKLRLAGKLIKSGLLRVV